MKEIETSLKIYLCIRCWDHKPKVCGDDIAAHIDNHHDSTFADARKYISPNGRIVRKGTDWVEQGVHL